MTATRRPEPHPRVERWDRIGLGIRCAYNPWHPPVLQVYLEAGRALARHGLMDARDVELRMCQVLLQTACDEALPWAWRSACAEQLTRPLSRLTTLLGRHEPAHLQALERAAQDVRHALALTPQPGAAAPRP